MYTIEKLTNHIFCGNVLENLKQYPDTSINMIITSPPYFGLRAYETINQIWDGDSNCQHEWETFSRKGISGGTNSQKIKIKGQENFQIVLDAEQGICKKCGAWYGELGREPDYHLYLNHLFQVFTECWRILRPDGTLWVNLGDSYAGSCQGSGSDKSKWKQGTNKGTLYNSPKGIGSITSKVDGIKNKSLIGIPDRFKIMMIDAGWICRNEIIWHKPNQFPSPIKDRFTVDFEKIFYFSKQRISYFLQQLEPYTNGTKMRNKRTVWSINTASYKGSHFAVFPEKLVETPILAGCPNEGIVLDPFMGSGTVGVVAKRLGKNWSGIELNPKYAESAMDRISKI